MTRPMTKFRLRVDEEASDEAAVAFRQIRGLSPRKKALRYLRGATPKVREAVVARILSSETDNIALVEAINAAHAMRIHGVASEIRRLVSPQEDRVVRLHALMALYDLEQQPASSVEVIRAALKDEEGGVRAEAMRAAGRLRLDALEPQVIEGLEDSNSMVRQRAAEALVNIGSHAAVEPMRRAATNWRFLSGLAQRGRSKQLERRLGVGSESQM